MSHTLTFSQERQVRAASGLDALAGVWLIAAPFVLNYSANGGSMWNSIIVGAAVLLLAGGQSLSEVSESRWPNWATVLLGAWLIASPFVLNYPAGSAAVWNDVISGIVVAGLGLVGALTASNALEE